MASLPAFLRRLAHAVWARGVRSRFGRPDACRMFGLDLVIAPGVLHPSHFRSSRILAEHLMTQDLRGLRLADLGAGSGLLALIAARQGADVVAIDLNPDAAACARGNAARNGLSHRVTVVESDVFATVTPQSTFEVIVTNPPFYPRAPDGLRDLAFAAGAGHSFFVKLAGSIPDRLSPQGRLVLVHSSDTDFAPVARILETAGLEERLALDRAGFFETLTVREFRMAQRT